MAGVSTQSGPQRGPIVISVDVMGGDRGPSAVVAGLTKAVETDGDLRFILHGPKAQI